MEIVNNFILRSKQKYGYSTRQAFFPMDFNFLFKIQENQFQCSYCGIFVSGKELTKDHVYPKSKGGGSITTSCDPCNVRKQDMKPIQWALEAYDKGWDLWEVEKQTL